MPTEHMGDTAKLVGAMMRLHHNTKFRGGLDSGGAPSAVASVSEHLDFLQLFCGELKVNLQEFMDSGHSGDGDGEARGDRDVLTAKLAEAQIRALVNSELEACVLLHEAHEFWQGRLERPGAGFRNWLEMGPSTWRTHGLADCYEEYFKRLKRCRKLLRTKVLSAGSLQLHLTQMKQAYVDGTIHDWNRVALVIIRRALPEQEGARAQHCPRRRRLSLASATSTPDMSPPHPLRRAISGFGTVRHNNNNNNNSSSSSSALQGASHVREQTIRKIFEGLRQEQDQTGDEARGLADKGDDDGDGDQDSPHRAGSDVSEEKGEEGFVLAQYSSTRHVPEGKQLNAAQLAERLLEEAPDDEMADTMQLLLDVSARLVKALRQQQKEMVPTLLGRCAIPSTFRRNWVWMAFATPAVVASFFYMYKERTGIRKSLLMVRASFWQFVKEHISEPFWGIYNDLVHNQPLMANSKSALEDSSHSLERMLEAFIEDTKPELSKAEVAHMAATGDMSVVSREYEKSIINAWKNFVAGDIVRMMLIQVQFIKREILIASTAIGQLGRENELNLRIMATVPAFLLAWGAYRAVRPLYYFVTTEKSRKSTFTAMRMTVLAMERLLNMRHRGGAWQRLTADVHSTDGGLAERVAGRAPSVGYSDNCTRLVTVSAGVAGSASSGVMVMRVLDELDLGKIMMLTHQLRRLMRSPRRLDRRDYINMQEDLAELVGERGLISVGQQLRIVQRMQRIYKFLAPSR